MSDYRMSLEEIGSFLVKGKICNSKQSKHIEAFYENYCQESQTGEKIRKRLHAFLEDEHDFHQDVHENDPDLTYFFIVYLIRLQKLFTS